MPYDGVQLFKFLVTIVSVSTEATPILSITIPSAGPKVTSILWGTLDEFLVTGHDNGDIVQWDMKTNQKLKMATNHEKAITDMQLSPDGKLIRICNQFDLPYNHKQAKTKTCSVTA